MPYADHVISFTGDGKIPEQGSFGDLDAEGGYISSFHLPPPEWNYESSDIRSIVHSGKSIATQLAKSTEDDASRRTGDVETYLYYVKAVGWMPTSIFVIAISAFVFCLSFPSKITPQLNGPLTDHQPLTLFSYLGEVVGCFERGGSKSETWTLSRNLWPSWCSCLDITNSQLLVSASSTAFLLETG